MPPCSAIQPAKVRVPRVGLPAVGMVPSSRPSVPPHTATAAADDIRASEPLGILSQQDAHLRQPNAAVDSTTQLSGTLPLAHREVVSRSSQTEQVSVEREGGSDGSSRPSLHSTKDAISRADQPAELCWYLAELRRHSVDMGARDDYDAYLAELSRHSVYYDSTRPADAPARSYAKSTGLASAPGSHSRYEER